MIAVIIAGGSGTRLWPLSTPDFPKHLLKLTGDESLLQNAYRRGSGFADAVYVITEAGHAKHVREQLPQLTDQTLIIEPARRGTANCILAGLHRIRQHHPEDESIAFIPADHFIRDMDGFIQSFKVAQHATEKLGRICLVGIEPTYPSTGFGYIQKATLVKGEDMVYDVARFKEKPVYDVAKEYVASGHYLWNCSYFVGSHETFLATIKKFSPFMDGNYTKLLATKDSDDFNKTYLSLASDTIDFALSDHVDNFLVVPGMFDWMDVGSFKDFYDVCENVADEKGNVVQGGRVLLDDVQNALVRNDEDKPLAIIGLDNVVVINTPNGVVVTRQDLAQKVGDISKKIHTEGL